MKSRNSRSGFSLIEIILAIGIFGIIATFVFLSYSNIIDVIGRTRIHALASSLINKQVEMVRNIPYDKIGIAGGFPVGVLPASTTLFYEGQQFVVSYFVRNSDDPFDGTQSGTPKDTAPGDYKLVELQVTCSSCFRFVPVVFTTWVAPQNLESATNNGSLFVNVFDASGQSIGNVDVLVKNTALSPTITINDTTNNSGTLQLVDIPTSTTSYQITVSKSGYTTSKTYPRGASGNPNPTKPHATVAKQLITAISFAIDRVSTINVKTQNQYCAAVSSVDMTQNGQKLIGSSPNVLLYSQSFTTNGSGESARTGLEWDTYNFSNTDAEYNLAGSMPPIPLTINPNTTTDLSFLVEPKTTSSSLLVTAITSAKVPIPGISVKLDKAGGGSAQSELPFNITNWQLISRTESYHIYDGNGGLTLGPAPPYPIGGNYYRKIVPFDFGSSTIDYTTISWTPVSQPAGTTLKFQVGATTDGSDATVTTGPDGTSNSYYTVNGGSLGSQYDNKRYLTFKIFLSTTDANVTPLLDVLTVKYVGPPISSSETKVTGQKQFSVTDWSGEGYASQDGAIESETVLGRLTLKSIGAGQYPTSTNSYLESNTIDFGTSTVSYRSIAWNPVSQPANTTLKFQLGVASSTDGSFAFTGPDGSGNSYYTAAANLPTIYNNNRYLRYKVFLNTTDTAVTPILTDMNITFESGCVPSGQVFWPALLTGSYTLTVNRVGYSTMIIPVTIGAGWQETRLTLP